MADRSRRRRVPTNVRHIRFTPGLERLGARVAAQQGISFNELVRVSVAIYATILWIDAEPAVRENYVALLDEAREALREGRFDP